MSVSVTVDDREPAAVAAAFRDHPDVASVTVRRLDAGEGSSPSPHSPSAREDAGDVVIGDVGFERKTPDDYLRSTLGRGGTVLEDQVRQLTGAYAHAYVLLEGTLADVEERWPGVSAAAVRGSVASLTARTGVPVLPCGDLDRLVDLAVRLARKHAEAPSPRPLSPGAVPARDEPVTKRMYGTIEGIGPGTAAALYEVFPSVAAAARASRAELEAVEGVGPKRAAAVHAALRGDG